MPRRYVCTIRYARGPWLNRHKWATKAAEHFKPWPATAYTIVYDQEDPELLFVLDTGADIDMVKRYIESTELWLGYDIELVE